MKEEEQVWYNLREHVYLVRGIYKHCIYDFIKQQLFWIDNDIYTLIENLCGGKANHSTLSFKERENIATLLQEDILFETSEAPTGLSDIHSESIRPKINFAWIEITRNCNLKCRHCYAEQQDLVEGEHFCIEADSCLSMTYEDFNIAITELARIGIKSVQLIGGEPLTLGPILSDFIALAVSTFDFVEVFTNGTLLTKNTISIFKKFNVNVALSIYSDDSTEHDNFTGVSGSFNALKRSINLLLDMGVPFRLARTLVSSIPSTEFNLAGIPSGMGQPPRLVGRASIDLYDLNTFKLKMINKDYFCKRLDVNQIRLRIDYHNCFAQKIYVAKNLDVFPCVMERRVCHGNLKNNRLDELLDYNICRLHKGHIKTCKDCEFRFACTDCRPDSMGMEFLDKPWYCLYSPTDGSWMKPETAFEHLVVA